MFPEFVYESYHYDVQPDGLHISFCFRLYRPDRHGGVEDAQLCFEPTALIEARPFLHPERLPKQSLDMLVFHIGMIELISYWKCVCSPRVVIKPYHLDESQTAFWKKIYFNGLGEFFYTNGITASQDDFMTLVSSDTPAVSLIASPFTKEVQSAENHIVPIGGGKDSVVTLELLRAGGERPLPLIMNPRGATTECARVAGYSLDEVLVIRRTIHPLLLDLNKKGCLNGHTPFSAMLAFYTLLGAALTGTRCRIALSNENSANESTVAGSTVNHQYSKSLEFENDFRDYVSRNLSSDFNYYSFLRPLSELQIAMLFARQKAYFDVFKSCNVGSKEDIWCGHCAKCLFAYLILSPFIAPERLNAIFGKNMLDDETLRHEFLQLTGEAETKPFECVGTVDEVHSALTMTLAKWYADSNSAPVLLQGWKQEPVRTPLDTFFPDHNVPSDDLELLNQAFLLHPEVESLHRYRQLFNLLNGKSILIAGYGREGKSSHQLLQRFFPTMQVDIAQNDGEIADILGRKQYDLIIKSPGIPSFRFEGLCAPEVLSSQVDIFLQVYGDQTIGITGTKGKSTTTHLIYSALRSAKRECVLAGNMGIPLFDILDSLQNDTIVVAELSCHQLENIHRAPHIGVLLNLFQEHLDHYHSYLDYQMAKMQIALRQQAQDHFFYCADNEELSLRVEESRKKISSTIHVCSLEDARHFAPLQSISLPLQGDHNLSDAYIAWQVARCCGVEDADTAQALSHFHGLEHRMERVAEVKGVTYYNDSISTIPQTTIAAIEALRLVDSLILGGFDRGIDYAPLASYLLDPSSVGTQVRNIVLVGSAGRSIEEACRRQKELLLKKGVPLPEWNMLTHFEADYKMEEAVSFCAKHSEKGHICLLSPAASSYDHYKNFEYRGRDFKECVMNLS